MQKCIKKVQYGGLSTQNIEVSLPTLFLHFQSIIDFFHLISHPILLLNKNIILILILFLIVPQGGRRPHPLPTSGKGRPKKRRRKNRKDKRQKTLHHLAHHQRRDGSFQQEPARLPQILQSHRGSNGVPNEKDGNRRGAWV